MSDVRILTEYVTQYLVSDSNAVFVRELKGSSETVVELTAAPDDKGRVIGEQGWRTMP